MGNQLSSQEGSAAGTPGKDAGHGTGYGLLLWLRHVLDAEAGSRGLTRVFARHDTLLSDWQAETDRIARALNLDCPRPAADARPGIGAPEQKPEHPSDAVQAPMLTEVVTILDRWAQAGEDADDRDRLDRLREALNLLAPFCDEPAEESLRQKARADEAERKLSVMAVQLREMTRRQEAALADRLKLTIALDDPTAMSRDIASLAEQVDAKLRTLAQEQQDLNKTRGQLAHRENELQAHFARREAEIFASASWRVTAPLRFLSRQIRH